MDNIDISTKNDLTNNDMKNIVKMSFESYLQDSINAFKDLKSKDLEIEKSQESINDELILIKDRYKSMSQESATAEETKGEFSAKIKNFFIKIWSTICEIFTKFAEIVVSLIKSLIIFIQKKRIQATSIINMLKDKGVNGLTADGIDIYELITKNGYKIKTLNLSETPNKDSKATFSYIHKLLNEIAIKEFVKSPIILKNKDSIFNTESLKKYLQQDLIGNDNPDDEKLSRLEIATDYLYSQAVFYGEVSPNHKKSTDLLNKYKSYLDNKEINKVAHLITYRLEKPSFKEIDLNIFFDVSIDDRNEKFSKAWDYYCKDTKLVLDKGGYIDILEEVLKRYKDIAKNDAQNIKEISNYIKSQLENIGNDTEYKVQGKIKRFTNLILKVKNIKNHFIRLRQTVILDIITLYSMENRAWYLATGKADLVVNGPNDPERSLVNDGKNIKDTVSFDMNKGEIKYRDSDESLKNI